MSGCLQALMGSGSLAVNILDHSISSEIVGSATAGYRLTASGQAQRRVQGTYTAYPDEWLRLGDASNFAARATLQSGTLTAGTLGSWLQLNADREWSCTDASGDASPVTATLLIEIGPQPSGPAIDSATIILTANRDA